MSFSARKSRTIPIQRLMGRTRFCSTHKTSQRCIPRRRCRETSLWQERSDIRPSRINLPCTRSQSMGTLPAILAAAASGKRVEIRNLDGDYRLADGKLTVSNLRTDMLGGLIVGRAEMNHLDAIAESQIHASVQDMSLRALQ